MPPSRPITAGGQPFERSYLQPAERLPAVQAQSGGRAAAEPTGRCRSTAGSPITARRYDHLWQRLGRHLPWGAVAAELAARLGRNLALRPETGPQPDPGEGVLAAWRPHFHGTAGRTVRPVRPRHASHAGGQPRLVRMVVGAIPSLRPRRASRPRPPVGAGPHRRARPVGDRPRLGRGIPNEIREIYSLVSPEVKAHLLDTLKQRWITALTAVRTATAPPPPLLLAA